ncbi:MAG: glycosyltransferase family 4 protein [Ignavibacteriaceae bacterium]|jgi:glycosyltransferase involved in cell wall biosynthesis|nr:glycosyltransferase family 4 protein [Ignavibacteriaceae bacterium]
MKKLLYTSFSGFPTPDTGGPNKVIHQLMQNIDLDKFNVSFLSKHSNFQYSKEDKKKSIQNKISFKPQLTSKLFNKSNFYRSIVTNPFYLRYHYYKASKFFSSKKEYINTFDIIHAHDPRVLLHFSNCSSKKILTIHSKGSLVTDATDYYKESSLYNKLLKQFRAAELKAVGIANIVTFPSLAAKNLYLSQLNLDNNPKYKVIYNGIDINFIRSINPDPALLKRYKINDHYDIKILNIADHIRTKNIDLIINILNILKHDHKINPLLVNIGKGPETDRLTGLVKNLSLEGNVMFLGTLTNFQILSLMKCFDYFILLSQRVVFDMVILEALASGITVIASNDGGNKEIIENTKNGFLFCPNNFDDILPLLINKVKLPQVVDLFKFDISSIMKDYYKVYEE